MNLDIFLKVFQDVALCRTDNWNRQQWGWGSSTKNVLKIWWLPCQMGCQNIFFNILGSSSWCEVKKVCYVFSYQGWLDNELMSEKAWWSLPIGKSLIFDGEKWNGNHLFWSGSSRSAARKSHWPRTLRYTFWDSTSEIIPKNQGDQTWMKIGYP